VKPL
jgi:hypothetical protein